MNCQLFMQVLESHDLSCAGQLFSIDSRIVELDVDVATIFVSEIISSSDYVLNRTDQSLVEICVSRLMAAIRDTDTLSKHSPALLYLLKSCIQQEFGCSVYSPYSKLAADILSCFFLSCANKSAVALILPTAVHLLRDDCGELSRMLSNYLCLVAADSPTIVAEHLQVILESITRHKNRLLTHVLPYVYLANPKPIIGSLGNLLCQLPDCGPAEKSSLFRLCTIIACHSPTVLQPYLSALSLHLVLVETSSLVLPVFVELSNILPDAVVPFIPCILQAVVVQPSANIFPSIHLLTNLARKLQAQTKRCLAALLSLLPSTTDRQSRTAVLFELRSLGTFFPELLSECIVNFVRSVHHGSRSVSMELQLQDILLPSRSSRLSLSNFPTRAADSTLNIISNDVDRLVRERHGSPIRPRQDTTSENRIISEHPVPDLPYCMIQQSTSPISRTRLQRSDSSPTPSSKYRSMQIRRPWHVAENLASQYRYRPIHPRGLSESNASFRSSNRFLEPHRSPGILSDRSVVALPIRRSGANEEDSESATAFHRLVVGPSSQSVLSRRYRGRLTMLSLQSGLERSEHRNMVSLRNGACSTHSSWMAKTRTLNNSYDWQRRMYINHRQEWLIMRQDGSVDEEGSTHSSSLGRNFASPWARVGTPDVPGAQIELASFTYRSSSRPANHVRDNLLAVTCDVSQTAVVDPRQARAGSRGPVAARDYAASLRTIARQMPFPWSREGRRQQQISGSDAARDAGQTQESTASEQQDADGVARNAVSDSHLGQEGLDTVKHFCAKHLGSIRVYMNGLCTRLPVPVAVIPLENSRKPACFIQFACSVRGSSCLYSQNRFSICSKNARLWIHLMVLEIQIAIVDCAKCSTGWNLEHDPAQHPDPTRQLDLTMASLKRTFELMEGNSGSSFVQLITSSFPSRKDEAALRKELSMAGYFDVFKLHSSGDTKTSPYSCFVCSTPDVPDGLLPSSGAPSVEGRLEMKHGPWRLIRLWKTCSFRLRGTTFEYSKNESEWSEIGDVRTVRMLPERRLLVVSRSDDVPSCTFKICAGDDREKFLLRARNLTEERRWKNGLLAAVARRAQRSDGMHSSSSGVIYV